MHLKIILNRQILQLMVPKKIFSNALLKKTVAVHGFLLLKIKRLRVNHNTW